MKSEYVYPSVDVIDVLGYFSAHDQTLFQHGFGVVAFSINVDSGLHFLELLAHILANKKKILRFCGCNMCLHFTKNMYRSHNFAAELNFRLQPETSCTLYLFTHTCVQLVVDWVPEIFVNCSLVGCCSRSSCAWKASCIHDDFVGRG